MHICNITPDDSTQTAMVIKIEIALQKIFHTWGMEFIIVIEEIHFNNAIKIILKLFSFI